MLHIMSFGKSVAIKKQNKKFRTVFEKLVDDEYLKNKTSKLKTTIILLKSVKKCLQNAIDFSK